MINFPQNPAAGQVYTFGVKSWKWNGRAWDLQTISDSQVARAEAAAVEAGNQLTTKRVADYAALRALTADVTAIYVTGILGAAAPTGIAGVFLRDYSDTTSADDNATCIVTSSGARFKRPGSKTEANVLWFGADRTGTNDSTAAIAAARAWLATTRGKLIFPQGVYLYSVSPNWAIHHAQVTFEGDVRLRYTGVGNAVIIDAGPDNTAQNANDAVVFTPGLLYGLQFGWGNRPMIEAPAGAGHGIYVRSAHHCKIGGRVRGCGNASSGLYVAFAVCTEFDVPVSGNEDGWYLNAKPANGYYLTRRNAGETTSYCTFLNPVVEGPTIGIYRHATLGNSFFGGTAEACGQYGTYGHTTSAQDRFYGTDFEVNTLADVYDTGDSSAYIDCDTYTQLTLGSTSKNLIVQGGRHKKILADAGSQFGTVADVVYDRFTDGTTFTDAGTGTIVRNVRNSVGKQYLSGTLAQATVNIPDISQSVINVAVTGAKMGDIVTWSYDQVLPDVLLFQAQVNAVNNVRLQATNKSGAQVTIPAGNWKVQLIRQ